MKQNELMKHFRGVDGCEKKNRKVSLFFYFWMVLKAILGSFSCIMFINAYCIYVFEAVTLYFMNYMQFYEVGGFMAIFVNALDMTGEKMKENFCASSLKFIFWRSI